LYLEKRGENCVYDLSSKKGAIEKNTILGHPAKANLFRFLAQKYFLFVFYVIVQTII
jgi:hypothetical protein